LHRTILVTNTKCKT